MSELVQLTKIDGIAVVTINNPPVNALSAAVSAGIAAAVAQIEKDDAVKAVVFIGAGRTFIAGADIKEFGELTSGKIICRESLKPLLLRIEDLRMPVVMAIHGVAFGGGLELAMAGHYRIALPSAQVGQPEVKLGIIPGAAGTQRLPRLAGVAKAVEMCAEGAPLKAEDALSAGILDRLVEGDLMTAAIAFAKEVAAKPAPKTRERSELGTPEQNAAIFAAARETTRKKQRGLLAPLAAIDAIEAATTLPFEQGCQKEEELFTKCLFSDQSKALIHAFFGEREVAKIPDVPKETPTHGRRHRHGFCQRGNSGAPQGNGSGRARSRLGQHSEKLCQLRQAWPFHATVRRRAPQAHQTDVGLQRIRERRYGYRSGF